MSSRQRTMTAALFLCAVLLLAGDRAPRDCSIIELIANPGDWAGATVRTIGFVSVGSESSGIYLSEVDARLSIWQNGLLLDLRSAQIDDDWIEAANGSYTIVEATFEPLPDGLPPWRGRLFDVRRLDSMEQRRPAQRDAAP